MHDPIHWSTTPCHLGSMYEGHVRAHADAVGELKLRARTLDKGLRSLRGVKLFFDKLAEQHREHARMLVRLSGQGVGSSARAQGEQLCNGALQAVWDELREHVHSTAVHHTTLANELESNVCRPLDTYATQAPRDVRQAVHEAEACERKLNGLTTNATRAAAHAVRCSEDVAAAREAEAQLRADGEAMAPSGPGAAQLLRLLEIGAEAREALGLAQAKAEAALEAANEAHSELYGARLPAATRAVHAAECERVRLLDEALRHAAAAIAALPSASVAGSASLCQTLAAARTAAPPVPPLPPAASPPYTMPPLADGARAGAAHALLQRVETSVSRQASGSSATGTVWPSLRGGFLAAAQAVSSAVGSISVSDGAAAVGGGGGAKADGEGGPADISMPLSVQHTGHMGLGLDGALSSWGDLGAAVAPMTEPVAVAARPQSYRRAGLGLSGAARDADATEPSAESSLTSGASVHEDSDGVVFVDAPAAHDAELGSAEPAVSAPGRAAAGGHDAGSHAAGSHAAGSDEPVWYYLGSDVSTQGPITYAQLALIVEGGAVTRETYVWREGMAEWQLAADVPEAAALCTPSPSLAPPPPPPAHGRSGGAGGDGSPSQPGAENVDPRLSPSQQHAGVLRLGGTPGTPARPAARAESEHDEPASGAVPFKEALRSFNSSKMRHVTRKSMLPQVRRAGDRRGRPRGATWGARGVWGSVAPRLQAHGGGCPAASVESAGTSAAAARGRRGSR